MVYFRRGSVPWFQVRCFFRRHRSSGTARKNSARRTQRALANWESAYHLGTRWSGFSCHCHWRFSLKPRACSKSRKCLFLQGFRARDGVGGRPVVSSLWIRFEPFRVPRGVYHVPWFRRHRSSATRKSPKFPRRNAKTRWGEPAGLFDSSHLAVAVLVEAAGLRLGSRKCCK